MFFVFKIISFEVKVLISVNYEKNACEQWSQCEKAVLRFQIQLRDIIHNSICLMIIEHLNKSPPVQTSAVFRTG